MAAEESGALPVRSLPPSRALALLLRLPVAAVVVVPCAGGRPADQVHRVRSPGGGAGSPARSAGRCSACPSRWRRYR